MNLFTTGPQAQAALAKILPLIVVAQPLNSLVFAADGVLPGAYQFVFQARAMALSGVAALSAYVVLDMGMVGNEQQQLDTLLVHVWWALIALQVMRGVTSYWKLVDKDSPIRLWQPPEN